MDVLFAAFPLLLLIWLLVKPRPVAAAVALPIAAACACFVRLAWFADPPLAALAALVDGAWTALTPLLIVGGAIFFFRVLEAIGALASIRDWFLTISPHPVARLMIVGWAFPFLIEGVAGFGTPAALAAPILVGLGVPALRAAALTLAMNSVPVTFGAIGTPMWFGFAPLELDPDTLQAVAFRAALLGSLAALVVPLVALRFVLAWSAIRAGLPFILLVVLATVLPHLLVAMIDSEFPSVVGGACGLIVGVLAARRGIGLPSNVPAPASSVTVAGEREGAAAADASQAIGEAIPAPSVEPVSGRRIALAFAPFGLVVGILVLTRIPALGIRDWLAAAESVIELQLGSLARLGIGASGSLVLERIFGTNASAGLQTLYVPGLLPFALVAVLVGLAGRLPLRRLGNLAGGTLSTLRRPAAALIAAVILVELLLIGGERGGARLLGSALASIAGPVWPLFAPLLGAFGSFISGSATVANLTFGGIQAEIAAGTDLPLAGILALQAAGGAMGNMVCVHNIVAVLAVLGLPDAEGQVLRLTVRVLAVYALLLAIAAWFL